MISETGIKTGYFTLSILNLTFLKNKSFSPNQKGEALCITTIILNFIIL